MTLLVIGALLWSFLSSGISEDVEREKVFNCWSPASTVMYDIPTARIHITIVPTLLTACRIFTDSVSIYLNISEFNETITTSVSAFNYSERQTITFECPRATTKTLENCVKAMFTSKYASLYIQTVRYRGYVDFTSISGNRENLTKCYSGVHSVAVFDYKTGEGTLKFVETGFCDYPEKPEIVSGTLTVKSGIGGSDLSTTFDNKQQPSQPQTLTFTFDPIPDNQRTMLFSAITSPWLDAQLDYKIKVSTTTNNKVEIPLSMKLTGLYSSAKASCIESLVAFIYGDRIRILMKNKSNPNSQDCQLLSNGYITFTCHFLYISSNLKTTIKGISLSKFNFSSPQTLDFQCANGDLTCKSFLDDAFRLTNLNSIVLMLEITEVVMTVSHFITNSR